MEFRLLTPREIDCRVQQVRQNGCTVLLYKDARCDMAILDETVGPMNWTRYHSRDNANCTVSIWDAEKGQWISKEDTGTESNTEAEKGLASDSFKRACVNWGIGRELYTAPFIWIPAESCTIKPGNKQGTFMCADRFAVDSIHYNEFREIDAITIINAKTKTTVFSMGGKSTGKRPEKATPAAILCETCGKPMGGYTAPNGKVVTPEKARDISVKFYGKCLCPDCMKAVTDAS